jgi:K+-transporting ATPase ATPase A chain
VRARTGTIGEGAGTIDDATRWGTAAWLQLILILAVVSILHVPLGDYPARVYTAARSLRIERMVFRLVGVDPGSGQRWSKYLSSLLAFSALSVLLLYGILLAQNHLPAPWGRKGMTPALAFNTAISFTTNTSWQNYPGESVLGHVGLEYRPALAPGPLADGLG